MQGQSYLREDTGGVYTFELVLELYDLLLKVSPYTNLTYLGKDKEIHIVNIADGQMVKFTEIK